MKTYIVFSIVILLLSGIFFYLLMRQNQNLHKLELEHESLQNRLAAVELLPQTGQDDEKMKLATQLAEANTKLINADFDKMKLDLKESNQEWLWNWTAFLGVMFAVFGIALWFFVKSLIADRVEGHLKGFQKSVDKVSILDGQLEALKKELAVSVLDNFTPHYPVELEWHNEAIKALSDEMLLEVFSDKTRDLGIRWKAADVLLTRNLTQLILPVLTFLNNIVDSDLDKRTFGERFRLPSKFWSKLNGINNKETYQELKNFLNLLIIDNPKNKDIFLTWTVILLVQVSSELDRSDSVSMITETIPDLDNSSFEENDLKNLIEYFNKFQEHEGIKEIYNAHVKGKFPELEEKCLDLLEEKFPDFVKEQREEKASTNSESEGT